MHIHICRSIGFRGVRSMKCRLTDMRHKEVISAVDGARDEVTAWAKGLGIA